MLSLAKNQVLFVLVNKSNGMEREVVRALGEWVSFGPYFKKMRQRHVRKGFFVMDVESNVWKMSRSEPNPLKCQKVAST